MPEAEIHHSDTDWRGKKIQRKKNNHGRPKGRVRERGEPETDGGKEIEGPRKEEQEEGSKMGVEVINAHTIALSLSLSHANFRISYFERHTHIQKETEIERDRKIETDRQRDRDRETETERHRQRERERERDTHTHIDTEGETKIGLLYKLLQSGVGGKAYDIIKSMYTNNMCSIRIGHKRTDFISNSQEWGVRQGCCLSPALVNIYINDQSWPPFWNSPQCLVSFSPTPRSNSCFMQMI